VDLVEPESAVVDEDGSAGAWPGFAVLQLSGTVKSILGRGEHRIGVVYASDAC
jgi:hypothetical protein